MTSSQSAAVIQFPSRDGVTPRYSVDDALISAGATPEELDALADDPIVAEAAVLAARRIILARADADNAAVRRETLAKKIRKCSELNTRQRNLLYYNGIETIGDLVLRTEAELRVYNGAGPHFMATVNELLALLKLEFLDPDGDALEYAVTLYGGAEFVPTAHMYLWQERLDRLSFEYLQKYSTLGELAETSVMAYMVWRKSSVEEHPSQYGAQVQRVRDGLHRAGLHFRGEPSAYIK